MQEIAVRQLLSFSHDQAENQWQGHNYQNVKSQNQLEMVTSWNAIQAAKNNFCIRNRKNHRADRKLSIFNRKKKDMHKTTSNLALRENKNPSSLYYLEADNSTFYKRFNGGNLNSTNSKGFQERPSRILSNVINLSK